MDQSGIDTAAEHMTLASGSAVDPLPPDAHIDKKKISALLQALGVDLTHPLTPSFILATFDLLAVVDLAMVLSEDLSLVQAARVFHTFCTEQPEDVREVQRQVLLSMTGAGIGLGETRLQQVRHLVGLPPQR
jgi:hypothetical protein